MMPKKSWEMGQKLMIEPCAWCRQAPFEFYQPVGVPLYRCETLSPKKCPGVWSVAVPSGDWNNHQTTILARRRKDFEAGKFSVLTDGFFPCDPEDFDAYLLKTPD